jgi:hypothetical protein
VVRQSETATKKSRPANGAAAESELGRRLGEAVDAARDVGANARLLATLGWRKLKVRALDGLIGVAVLLLALVAVAVLAIAATLRFVAGVDHAFAEWSGQAWVGELVGGLLLLGLLFGGAVALRARLRGRLIERALAREPEPDGAPRAPKPEPEREPRREPAGSPRP